MSAEQFPRRFRVHIHYESPYPGSIVFGVGERVAVGEEFADDPDWENWVRCYATGGREAWVPRQFLDIDGGRGVFSRQYDARELTVTPGDIIIAEEIINGFALGVNQDGQRGWVPLKCLEESA